MIKNGAKLDARNQSSVAAAVPRGVTLVSLRADGRGTCIVCTKSLSLLNCKKITSTSSHQPSATSRIRGTKQSRAEQGESRRGPAQDQDRARIKDMASRHFDGVSTS